MDAHHPDTNVRVYSASTVSRDELDRSPVLQALLPEERPERLAVVLVGRERRQETLLIDRDYLDFAGAAGVLDTTLVEELDLPRRALVARVVGWPDVWDTADLVARQRRLVRGVWEFASDRETEDDHPLL